MRERPALALALARAHNHNHIIRVYRSFSTVRAIYVRLTNQLFIVCSLCFVAFYCLRPGFLVSISAAAAVDADADACSHESRART